MEGYIVELTELPINVNQHDLESVFCPCGASEVSIRPGNNSKQRYCGKVTFDSEKSARGAIKEFGDRFDMSYVGPETEQDKARERDSPSQDGSYAAADADNTHQATSATVNGVGEHRNIKDEEVGVNEDSLDHETGLDGDTTATNVQPRRPSTEGSGQSRVAAEEEEEEEEEEEGDFRSQVKDAFDFSTPELGSRFNRQSKVLDTDDSLFAMPQSSTRDRNITGGDNDSAAGIGETNLSGMHMDTHFEDDGSPARRDVPHITARKTLTGVPTENQDEPLAKLSRGDSPVCQQKVEEVNEKDDFNWENSSDEDPVENSDLPEPDQEEAESDDQDSVDGRLTAIHGCPDHSEGLPSTRDRDSADGSESESDNLDVVDPTAAAADVDDGDDDDGVAAPPDQDEHQLTERKDGEGDENISETEPKVLAAEQVLEDTLEEERDGDDEDEDNINSTKPKGLADERVIEDTLEENRNDGDDEAARVPDALAADHVVEDTSEDDSSETSDTERDNLAKQPLKSFNERATSKAQTPELLPLRIPFASTMSAGGDSDQDGMRTLDEQIPTDRRNERKSNTSDYREEKDEEEEDVDQADGKPIRERSEAPQQDDLSDLPPLEGDPVDPDESDDEADRWDEAGRRINNTGDNRDDSDKFVYQVRVSSIPMETSEESLNDIFEMFGSPHIKLQYVELDRWRREALVNFWKEEDARTALEFLKDSFPDMAYTGKRPLGPDVFVEEETFIPRPRGGMGREQLPRNLDDDSDDDDDDDEEEEKTKPKSFFNSSKTEPRAEAFNNRYRDYRPSPGATVDADEDQSHVLFVDHLPMTTDTEFLRSTFDVFGATNVEMRFSPTMTYAAVFFHTEEDMLAAFQQLKGSFRLSLPQRRSTDYSSDEAEDFKSIKELPASARAQAVRTNELADASSRLKETRQSSQGVGTYRRTGEQPTSIARATVRSKQVSQVSTCVLEPTRAQGYSSQAEASPRASRKQVSTTSAKPTGSVARKIEQEDLAKIRQARLRRLGESAGTQSEAPPELASKDSEESEEEVQLCQLIVQQLPEMTDIAFIKETFSPYGAVNCDIRVSSLGTRYAVVSFLEQEDAIQAYDAFKEIYRLRFPGDRDQDDQVRDRLMRLFEELEAQHSRPEPAKGDDLKKIEYEVYVGNLPDDATEDDLMELFQAYNPQQAKIKSPEESKPHVFGFVMIATLNDALKAISDLHHTDWRGMTLKVAMSQRTVDLMRKAAGSSGKACEVYVGNLPAGTKMSDILALFKDYTAYGADIARNDGNSSTFGFARLSDYGNAQRAISDLNGRLYRGNTLKVNFSKRSGGHLFPVQVKSGEFKLTQHILAALLGGADSSDSDDDDRPVVRKRVVTNRKRNKDLYSSESDSEDDDCEVRGALGPKPNQPKPAVEQRPFSEPLEQLAAEDTAVLDGRQRMQWEEKHEAKREERNPYAVSRQTASGDSYSSRTEKTTGMREKEPTKHPLQTENETKAKEERLARVNKRTSEDDDSIDKPAVQQEDFETHQDQFSGARKKASYIEPQAKQQVNYSRGSRSQERLGDQDRSKRGEETTQQPEQRPQKKDRSPRESDATMRSKTPRRPERVEESTSPSGSQSDNHKVKTSHDRKGKIEKENTGQLQKGSPKRHRSPRDARSRIHPETPPMSKTVEKPIAPPDNSTVVTSSSLQQPPCQTEAVSANNGDAESVPSVTREETRAFLESMFRACSPNLRPIRRAALPDPCEVAITHVDDRTGVIWGWPSSCPAFQEDARFHKNLLELLQNSPEFEAYKPGLKRCVAKYEGQWYRGFVLRELPNGEADVFYVDYGNRARCELFSLRSSPDHFWEKGPMALPFMLPESEVGAITKHDELPEGPRVLRVLRGKTNEQDYPILVSAKQRQPKMPKQ